MKLGILDTVEEKNEYVNLFQSKLLSTTECIDLESAIDETFTVYIML
jgi:hypothetical protein